MLEYSLFDLYRKSTRLIPKIKPEPDCFKINCYLTSNKDFDVILYYKKDVDGETEKRFNFIPKNDKYKKLDLNFYFTKNSKSRFVFFTIEKYPNARIINENSFFRQIDNLLKTVPNEKDFRRKMNLFLRKINIDTEILIENERDADGGGVDGE